MLPHVLFRGTAELVPKKFFRRALIRQDRPILDGPASICRWRKFRKIWLSGLSQELLPGELLQARRMAVRLSHEAVNHIG